MKVSRSERLAPASGIVFVALFLPGAILFSGPDPWGSGATLVSHYASSSARARDWIGAILIALAVPFFLWFLGTLRSTLLQAEGGLGRLSGIVLGGGTALAGLVLVGDALQLGPTAAVDWGDTSFTLDPDTARILLFSSDLMVIGAGGMAAAAMVAAATLIARRTGVLPKPIVWLGYVLAPVLILSEMTWGVSFAFLLLWVLATSTVMLRRSVAPVVDARPVLAS